MIRNGRSLILIAAAAAVLSLAGRPAAAQIPPKIAFQGVLYGPGGKPLPDGTYQAVFRLYDAPSGGTAIWTEPATGTKPIVVSGGKGLFSTMLGDTTPLSSLAFDKPCFVGVKVGTDPEMTPLITLCSVPYALSSSRLTLPYSATSDAGFAASLFSVKQTAGIRASVEGVNNTPAPASALDRGAMYGAGVAGISNTPGAAFDGPPARVVNGGPGVYAENNTLLGIGLRASATGDWGVGVLAEGSAIGVRSLATGGLGIGVQADAPAFGVHGSTSVRSGVGIGGFNNGEDNTESSIYPGAGVYGYSHVGGLQVDASFWSDGGAGVYGENPTNGGRGVVGLANGADGKGVHGVASGDAGRGVEGFSTGGIGVWGETDTGTGVTAWGRGASRAALEAFSENGAGVAASIRHWTSGEVLHLRNGGLGDAGIGGGDFIRATNHLGSDTKFRVLTTGEVRSDAGFNTPAADFAEMLPATTGLAAGDVLAIGADGRLVLSREAYQTTLAGVYSTAPGFIGGSPVEGAPSGTVPLAIVGIVPVKVCAENGAIAPGDLLTTSSTPGCAMKATDRARLTGALLGKALETFSGDTPGAIRVLLNMK